MAKEIIIDENRGFQGVWIPKNLYTTNKFSLRTKFFLIEVKSLSKKWTLLCNGQAFFWIFGNFRKNGANHNKRLEEV